MVDNGGWTINGVAASTYGITLRYSPGIPMLPDTRDRTVEIPGKNGSYWFGSDVGQRSFSLPCRFEGCIDAAALDVLIRAFARLLVDVNGKPRALSLIFDDAPTITYTVRYSGAIPFDRAWLGPEFTLELVADDPYGHEAEQTAEATITTSPGVMTVTSSGATSTPARLEITNTGATPITGFTITTEYEV